MKILKSNLLSFFAVSIIFSLLWLNCGVKPQQPSQSDFGTGPCTLEQLEWNSVIEGFDQEKTLKILSDLQAAAKAKPSGVVTEAGFDVNFSATINNIIKVANQKEFKVSQEVQDIMVALRRLGCDIQSGLFEGNLPAAQNKYLEILDRVGATKKKLTQ